MFLVGLTVSIDDVHTGVHPGVAGRGGHGQEHGLQHVPGPRHPRHRRRRHGPAHRGARADCLEGDQE